MNKLASEFLGTFALVFAGTGAVVINDVSGGAITHVGIALTFGLVVLALIYALGEVSGAHLNPAVTIGFWAAGRFPLRLGPGYVLAQLLGGIAASGLLHFMFDHPTLGATLPRAGLGQSFVLEVVLTLMLMFVILSVSTGAKGKGLLGGVAGGAGIGFEALFVGPVSGASINPARSLSPALVSGRFQPPWVSLPVPLFVPDIAGVD